MRRKGLTVRQALVFFFSLTVVFDIVAGILGVKLPKAISTMKEIKLDIVKLEEEKEGKIKKLESFSNEIQEMKSEIESMQVALEGITNEIEIQETSKMEQELQYAYLTFDDGPSENTIKILDFLKANHIKATFFVIGKQGYDEVYKRIVDEGHTLAIHSNTHVYSDIYRSVYAFMNDINTLTKRLEQLTGVRPNIMRFPGGSNNTVSYKYGGEELMDKLVKEVDKAGYVYYDWNVDSSDATEVNRDKTAIFNAVMNGVEGKKHAIILMHDASAKVSTVEALPQIVEGLRKKGYVLAPITGETPLVQFK